MSKKGARIFLLLQVFFVVAGFGLFFGLKALKQSPATALAEENIPGAVMGYPGAAPATAEGESTVIPEESIPAEEAAICDYAEWIGQPADEAAIKVTGRPYRILPPGSMMTMDFNPERINVETDESGIVIAVRCG